MVTFTQGQGKKGQGQMSPKNNIAIFSETITATDIKFGTMVPCGKVLENTQCMVTFTQGQGQIVKVKGKKSNFAIFLGNY